MFHKSFLSCFRWKSFVLDLMTSAKLSCPSCKLSVKTIALKLILSNQDSQKVKWNEIQRVLALPPVEYSFMTIILSSCDWFDTDQIKWLYEHFCRLMGSSCIEVWVDYQKFLSQNRLTKQSYLCNDRAMRQLSKDLVIKYLEAVSNWCTFAFLPQHIEKFIQLKERFWGSVESYFFKKTTVT